MNLCSCGRVVTILEKQHVASSLHRVVVAQLHMLSFLQLLGNGIVCARQKRPGRVHDPDVRLGITFCGVEACFSNAFEVGVQHVDVALRGHHRKDLRAVAARQAASRTKDLGTELCISELCISANVFRARAWVPRIACRRPCQIAFKQRVFFWRSHLVLTYRRLRLRLSGPG